MKIKIVRPCGTVVEAEGTAEECARLAQSLTPSPPLPVWFVPPTPWVQPEPWWPYPYQYTAPNSGEFRIDPLVVTSGTTVNVGSPWVGTVPS